MLKIVTANQPPLSIGLFGPWGIGKSTIVNILFGLIAHSHSNELKPIYFNAWKYSEDSFRRQFLIETARQVYKEHPDRDAKVRRLEQLNYTDVLREETQKNLLDRLREILTLRMKLREPAIARMVLALVVLLVGAGFGVWEKSVSPFLNSVFLALLVFLLKFKFEDAFVIQENPVYDPKLIFPEQFEVEFKSLVGAKGPLGKRTALIVIDDIDRCDPPTIKDVLISVKTFLGQDNCFFLIPCDDSTIVKVFGDPNQEQGYRDEMLRKYFNVGVRVAPLMATDLVDFANEVSKSYKIPASVVQVAVLANYRDARKMKHFLNTFSVKYAIAKARAQSGFMPVDIDKNLAGFAKLVLIEDLYPMLFARMIEQPEIYAALDKAATSQLTKEDLEKFGLQTWLTDYPGLQTILEKTRDINIEHIDVVLPLKTTNPEAGIPRGFELKRCIVQGIGSTAEEIVKEITTDGQRDKLAELLIDLLDKSTATFRKNTISISLALRRISGLFTPANQSSLAQKTSWLLVYDDEQKVFHQDAALALECAQSAGGIYLAKLAAKYEGELAAAKSLPDNIVPTVNALYRFTPDANSLSSALNKQFTPEVEVDQIRLDALAGFEIPVTSGTVTVFPGAYLLRKIADEISPDSSPSALEANQRRQKVLLKYWDAFGPLEAASVAQFGAPDRVPDSLGSLVAARLAAVAQQARGQPGYSQSAAFVVGLLLEQNECIEPKHSPQLWTYVQWLYGQIADPKEKALVRKLILIFAVKAPEPPRQAARTFSLQSEKALSDGELRADLEYLATLGEPEARALFETLIRQERQTLDDEIDAPTERTQERLRLCHENVQILQPSSLQDFLLKTLERGDGPFEAWRGIVAAFCTKLQPEFPEQIEDRCLTLVSNNASAARRLGYFELFATVLPSVRHEARVPLLQRYLAFCKHGDTGLRALASAILDKVRKAVDEYDFKLGLNKLVRDLCDIRPTEIVAYQQVVNASLAHQALFDDDATNDLVALSKRLIQETGNAALQDYGLSLLESLQSIPSKHEEDVVRLLMNLAGEPTAPNAEAGARVLKKLRERVSRAESRQAIDDFFEKQTKQSDA